MSARDRRSSGSPGCRRTSCTIGGAWRPARLPPVPLRCSFSLRQSSHSPSKPAWLPPHAHLRCSRPGTGAAAGLARAVAVVVTAALARVIGRHCRVRPKLLARLMSWRFSFRGVGSGLERGLGGGFQRVGFGAGCARCIDRGVDRALGAFLDSLADAFPREVADLLGKLLDERIETLDDLVREYFERTLVFLRMRAVVLFDAALFFLHLLPAVVVRTTVRRRRTRVLVAGGKVEIDPRLWRRRRWWRPLHGHVNHHAAVVRFLDVVLGRDAQVGLA